MTIRKEANMRKLVIGLAALIAALTTTLSVAYAATAGPPVLSITKVSCALTVNPGDAVCFSIVVENSGQSDSSQVHVEDDLPGGVLWHITNNTLGCQLATDPNPGNHQGLICNVDSIQRRHINASGSDFENGVAFVQVSGIAGACGSVYTNFGASLDDAGDNVHLVSGAASISVSGSACVTPTPTIPPPTATPTAPATTPTAPVPSPTPVVIIIHDTPVPGAVITPRPPNTGTGLTTDSSTFDGRITLSVISLFVGLGVVLMVSGLRSRKR